VSAFTAATGWVWNFPSLMVAGTLFGAGEAGCFSESHPRVHRLADSHTPIAAVHEMGN
jgi:hypothetical protein